MSRAFNIKNYTVVMDKTLGEANMGWMIVQPPSFQLGLYTTCSNLGVQVKF